MRRSGPCSSDTTPLALAMTHLLCAGYHCCGQSNSGLATVARVLIDCGLTCSNRIDVLDLETVGSKCSRMPRAGGRAARQACGGSCEGLAATMRAGTWALALLVLCAPVVATTAASDHRASFGNSFFMLWRVAMHRMCALPFLSTLEYCRPPHTPDEKLQVLAVGYGRTSTDSMRVGLSMLGYKPYHMSEVLTHGHLGVWAEYARVAVGQPDTDPEVMRAADRLLDHIEGQGYNATTDFPTCLLLPHLLRRYPEARVVLTLRSSPDKWAASFLNTIDRVHALTCQMPLSLTGGGVLTRFIADRMRLADPCARHTMEEAKASYMYWADHVRATVPPDQLLEHVATDGFEPLCDHLGIPADSAGCPASRGVAYPHVNAGSHMAAEIVWLERVTVAWPALVVGAVALSLLCLARVCSGSAKRKSE